MLPSILVIENDEQVLQFIAASLAGSGYSIQASRRADEAMRILHVETFDLVLADVELGPHEVNGHDIACWVAAQGMRSRVALTSGSAQECRKCPFNGNCPFLPKPFTKDQLLGFVASTLASTPAVNWNRVIEW